MSPCSQVEMSACVIVKQELQDKGDRKVDHTSDERTRVEPAGSNPAGKAEKPETTGSGEVAFIDGAPGKALVPGIPGRRGRGVGFAAARARFEQSTGRENDQESAAVVAQTLSRLWAD